MAVRVFGVTHSTIRDRHFPQAVPYSTASKPTQATVTALITDAGADLSGRLAQKGLSAATIDDDAGTNYPNAYAWCARYVRLFAAVEVIQAGATADPEVAKTWRSAYEKMQEALEEYGYLALGDAPDPGGAGDGVTTHISQHDLDTGDEDDISDVVPTFRRSDEL